MQGLTAKDLLNLTNAGGLKTQGNNSIFQTSDPNFDDLDKYQWSLVKQNGKDGLSTILTTDTYPAFVFDQEPNVYFTTVNDKQKTQLFKLNTDTQDLTLVHEFEKRSLAVQEVIQEKQLLLSGTTFLTETDGALPWHEVTEVPYWTNAEGNVNGKRHQLFIFDLKSKELHSLVPKDFEVSNFWYQDGHLFLSGAQYQNHQPFQKGLYEYDFTEKKLQELLKPETWSVSAVALLNDELYLAATDNKKYGIEENPNFYHLLKDTHEMQLVQEWDHNLSNIVIHDMEVVPGKTTFVHDNKLYFVATIATHNEIYTFDGEKIELVGKWDGSITSLAFQGDHLQFIANSPQSPQQLYQFEKDGQVKQLSHFNEFLKDRYLAKPKQIDYKDHNGDWRYGWVLYPLNYQEGNKYPAILEVHGGPRATYGDGFFHEMQMLASAGYFVFFTNIIGSEGWGDEYGDVRGKYGTVDYDDLMLFTDEVLKQVPEINEEKLGLAGGSYGGFMTNWVIGHTHRFSAAVSMRSIASWTAMYISDIGPEFVNDQMATDDLHSDDIDKLWFHSPLRYVNNVTTPTLFLHSDHDFRCPIPDAYQMFQALKLRNVPTKLVVFQDSNHDLSRKGAPNRRIKRLEETLNWFDKYLK
ncbi:S9 family peptidase [Lactobacillus panisapium]|uniref:alpha/beta hydrolase family protein n=1 Tax=Lactobacillus panisapium TaxID=2012495 RepID=UPI001C69EA7E|nr:S9 family peptidase [Lactobacillus panisapium]QYN58214.1 S9 family peptidase [Lactobacillus panisapium]